MRLRPDGGSFPPSAHFGKQEIHQVFLCFPNFRLRKNPTPPALAELCGVALNKKWNLPIAAVVNGIDALLTLLQVIHASAVQIIGALPLVAMCGVTMNFLIVQCRAKYLPRTEPKKV